MSDTTPRNPVSAPQRMADALLRSLTGTTATLRVTGTNTDTGMSELGLVATTFTDVVVAPAVLRKLRPAWKDGDQSQWELLLSATAVEQQVNALDLSPPRKHFLR